MNLLKNGILFLLLFTVSCMALRKTTIPAWTPYNESEELARNATHESQRMRYKLIQSKILDKNDIWKNVSPQISNFSEKEYLALKPFILEQDIPTLQSHIRSGVLSTKNLPSGICTGL